MEWVSSISNEGLVLLTAVLSSAVSALGVLAGQYLGNLSGERLEEIRSDRTIGLERAKSEWKWRIENVVWLRQKLEDAYAPLSKLSIHYSLTKSFIERVSGTTAAEFHARYLADHAVVCEARAATVLSFPHLAEKFGTLLSKMNLFWGAQQKLLDPPEEGYEWSIENQFGQDVVFTGQEVSEALYDLLTALEEEAGRLSGSP